MKQIYYYAIVISLAVTTLSSCTKEDALLPDNSNMFGTTKQFVVSSPLHFDDIPSLVSAMDSPRTKATNFVSYAETVMNEPGYDEKPNAIFSNRFGSILNSEGEVEFANYFLKVSESGLLFAPLYMKEDVRELCKADDIISKCKDAVRCDDINPDEIFYKIEGHDGIVLYDTFHFLSKEDNIVKDVVTKSISSNLQQIALKGPLSTFTAPSSGDQKVLFSDSKYCNDTKAFQQSYAVASDGGLKTKTMKKTLGIWNKIDNQIEGGITLFSVFEYGTFDNITSSTPDINKVDYGGETKYVYTISARGTTPQSHVPSNISSLVSEGNTLAQNMGLSISIDGIRFVLNDTNAVTVFSNKTKSGVFDKIDYNWPVPLSGNTSCTKSYLNRTTVPNYASYYVVGFLAYGQSTRNNETKGTAIGYNYWAR